MERKRSRASRIVIGLAVVSLAIGLSGAYPAGTATGEIRSTGSPHGDFIVRPTTCYSSGKAWLSGVWLITRMERTLDGKRGFKGGLQLLENGADGWQAVVESPDGCNGFNCPLQPVTAEHCQVFDLVSEARGWWWRRRGHARLECAFPAGGTLKADVTFRGCAHVMSSDAEP